MNLRLVYYFIAFQIHETEVMKTKYFFSSLVFLFALFLLSGCASGISRTGYQLPAGRTSKDLPLRPIAIQCNAKYDTNDVVTLGAIHAYDTGFSTRCDEAYVLDVFCREGNMLGADLINITEEHQPDVWSSCYRARAQFLRFKDSDKAKTLVSDAKYASDLIIKRSTDANKRNLEMITAGVMAGPLAVLIVGEATDPNNHPDFTNSVPNPKNVRKP